MENPYAGKRADFAIDGITRSIEIVSMRIRTSSAPQTAPATSS
jgi:hypothetical protein